MIHRAALAMIFCASFAGQLTGAQQPVEAAAIASGSYKISGDRAIQPTLIWDDGRKTFVDWPENIEAPAIFAFDAGGNESLVNSHYRDGRFVIDGIYSRLLFRLDRLVAKADRKVQKL